MNLAAGRGYEDMVVLLMEKKPDLDLPNRRGHTPLTNAAQYNRLTILRRLVEAGANINARDRDWVSDLQRSAAHGHKEVVSFFISVDADLASKCWGMQTALDWAVRAGNYEIAGLLVKAGADTDIEKATGKDRRDRYDNSILHHVAKVEMLGYSVLF